MLKKDNNENFNRIYMSHDAHVMLLSVLKKIKTLDTSFYTATNVHFYCRRMSDYAIPFNTT